MINNEIYLNDIAEIVNLSLPWEKLKNKTILISGATGMIGTMIVDVLMRRNIYFKENIKIIAVARNEKNAKKRFNQYFDYSEFYFVKHDVNETFNQEFEHIDYIIHAASNTHPILYSTDPIGTILTNIKGTENLLKLAIESNTKRFIFLSSVEIYGENRGDVEKFDESYLGYIDCNTLRAGYPESKRVGEALCNAYAYKYGMEIVIPRLGRTYGPTMLENDSKAIAQFIKKAVNGEDIVLKSEGKQRYSFCYVSDAVSAILTILLLGQDGKAYNVADVNSDISLRELAEKIAGLVEKKVEIDLPTEEEKAGFSNAKLALMDAGELKKLGWSSKNSIDVGVEKTIKILTENKGRP